MHDEAHRVSIFDLWHSHTVDVPLWTEVTLFLSDHIPKDTQRKAAQSHKWGNLIIWCNQIHWSASRLLLHQQRWSNTSDCREHINAWRGFCCSGVRLALGCWLKGQEIQFVSMSVRPSKEPKSTVVPTKTRGPPGTMRAIWLSTVRQGSLRGISWYIRCR